MESKIKIIFMALVLVLLSAAPALADPSTPQHMGDIEPPTQVEIETKGDLSAQLFRRLLGSAWTAVAGETRVPDQYGDATSGPAATFGKFSELLPTILGIAGVVAMAFAGAICIYLSGIFALSTAHEGKKLGGSKFNSMWVPVRMTMGCGLSAPVAGGLSVLQWACIACVALGINLANMTWQAASEYIIANVATNAQAVPHSVETEARDLMQPTFQAVLVQEMLKRRAGYNIPLSAYTQGWTAEDWAAHREEWRNPKILAADGSTGQYGGISVQGDYVLEHQARNGRMMIYFMPGPKMALGSLGGVSIPAPIYNSDDLKNPQKQAEYDAKLAITHARLQAFFQAAESLREHARYYVTGAGISGTEEAVNAVKPTISGADIVETYKRDVADGSAASIEYLAKAAGSKAKLSAALGIDGSGNPQGGWITAGVLPFLLASAESQFDLFSYGGGMQFVLIEDSMPAGTTSAQQSTWSSFLEYIGWHTPLHWDTTETTLLTRSTRYVTQELMNGRVYTGHHMSGDSQGAISRGITWAFFGGEMSNSGILSTTISAYASQNPISATIWFGDRLVTIGMQAVGISAVSGAIGLAPGMGWVSEVVNNPVMLFLMGCVLVAGGFLCYVVPVYFLIVWTQALWPWVVAVVQTLLASPIWAILHILPEGEGFAGRHARKGYVQLLDVALRPFLLVAAVCASYITIEGAAFIVIELFSIWANGAATFQDVSAPSQLVWALIFVSTIVVAMKYLQVDFLLKMPGQIITWAGGIGMSMGNSEQAANESTNVVAGSLGAGTRTISGAGAHLGSRGGKDGDKGDKDKDKGKGTGKGDLPANMTEKQ